MKSNGESGIAKNPYTRKELNNNVLWKLNKVIWLTKKVLNKKIKYKFDNDINVLSSEKKLELKAIEVFQKIDQLGYITDTKWLLNLSQIRLVRYLRELDDVWRYRAQLSNEAQRNICPPNGNPFLNIPLGTLEA